MSEPLTAREFLAAIDPAHPFIPEMHTDDCDDTSCVRCVPTLDEQLSAARAQTAEQAREIRRQRDRIRAVEATLRATEDDLAAARRRLESRPPAVEFESLLARETQRAAHFDEAARLLAAGGHDEDASNFLGQMSDAIRTHAIAAAQEAGAEVPA